jgi:hypothetical protein
VLVRRLEVEAVLENTVEADVPVWFEELGGERVPRFVAPRVRYYEFVVVAAKERDEEDVEVLFAGGKLVGQLGVEDEVEVDEVRPPRLVDVADDRLEQRRMN